MRARDPHDVASPKGDSVSSNEASQVEPRHPTVRIVDYAPVSASRQPRRVGFTRDLSDSGMCLGLDEAASVGSMLRVTVHDLSGAPLREEVARVVWTRPDTDYRFWHGLVLVRSAGQTAPASPGKGPAEDPWPSTAQTPRFAAACSASE